MSEWHITPEYILDNWTDEKFNLMVDKLVERRTRVKPSEVVTSDGSGLKRMGNMVKVIDNRGN